MGNILLFSGWQTCNIGDIGHTFGTLRYLEEFVPEASVSVGIFNSNDDVLRVLGERFPKVRVVPADYNELAGPSPLRDLFDESDLIIQNSGMHYNTLYGLEPTLLRVCSEQGKPFGLYGQSFDGFGDDVEEVVQMLSTADFIFCRDRNSLDYLKECGVTSSVMDFGPDGCFGIDVTDDAAALRYLQQVGLESGEFITVTLRSNVPNLNGHGNRLTPTVVTEDAAREHDRWAARLIELITSWVTKTGIKVLLAPEIDKEMDGARQLIWEKLPANIRSSVVCRNRPFWTVDEAAAIYARAKAVVSMEPHSCIIALANGVPALHYYVRKHGVKAFMFEDIGLGKWLHDIETIPVPDVLEQLLFIESNPEQARRDVADAMSRVHEASRRMSEPIRNRLSGVASAPEPVLA